MSIPDEVVARLRRALPIEQVILFGSRARGTAHDDSDWDFLVIMPTTLSHGARNLAVRRAGRIAGHSMDFLVRTPRELAEGFPLSKEILQEGRGLYDARHS